MADRTDLNDLTSKQAVREGVEGAKRVKESDAEVIARLAEMSTEEYEGRRKDEAKKLDWRVSILDRAVDKERQRLLAERRAAAFAERQEEEQPVLCPDLKGDDPIVLIEESFAGLGYGGDTKLPMLLYLCYTSRLLSFDIGNLLSHAQIVGAPSSGKNYLADTALSLIPDTAYLKIDAGSPKALIYTDEDLQHRVVMFTEADSLPISEAGNGKSLADGDSRSTAASALRNLASNGYLSYDIVERDPETGHFVTRHIEKPGPTLLITTTTRAISGQMGTRLWEVPMKESDEQVRAALDTCATTELTRERQVPSKLVQYQSYLQSRAPWDAIVRFAKELVEELFYKGANPRIQRDYQRILALIKAVTVLRHPQRGRDSKDRLISTLDDYKTVLSG
jgi:hypothetical protein